MAQRCQTCNGQGVIKPKSERCPTCGGSGFRASGATPRPIEPKAPGNTTTKAAHASPEIPPDAVKSSPVHGAVRKRNIEEIRALLKTDPHPPEGGFWKRLFRVKASPTPRADTVESQPPPRPASSDSQPHSHGTASPSRPRRIPLPRLRSDAKSVGFDEYANVDPRRLSHTVALKRTALSPEENADPLQWAAIEREAILQYCNVDLKVLMETLLTRWSALPPEKKADPRTWVIIEREAIIETLTAQGEIPAELLELFELLPLVRYGSIKIALSPEEALERQQLEAAVAEKAKQMAAVRKEIASGYGWGTAAARAFRKRCAQQDLASKASVLLRAARYSEVVGLIEEQKKSWLKSGIQVRVICAKALAREAEDLLAAPAKAIDPEAALQQRSALRSKAETHLREAIKDARRQSSRMDITARLQQFDQVPLWAILQNEWCDLLAAEASDRALSRVKDENNPTAEEIEDAHEMLKEAMRQGGFWESKRLHLAELRLLVILLNSMREKNDINRVVNQIIAKLEDVNAVFHDPKFLISDVMYLGRRETGTAILAVFEKLMPFETESALRALLEESD